MALLHAVAVWSAIHVHCRFYQDEVYLCFKSLSEVTFIPEVIATKQMTQKKQKDDTAKHSLQNLQVPLVSKHTQASV